MELEETSWIRYNSIPTPTSPLLSALFSEDRKELVRYTPDTPYTNGVTPLPTTPPPRHCGVTETKGYKISTSVETHMTQVCGILPQSSSYLGRRCEVPCRWKTCPKSSMSAERGRAEGAGCAGRQPAGAQPVAPLGPTTPSSCGRSSQGNIVHFQKSKQNIECKTGTTWPWQESLPRKRKKRHYPLQYLPPFFHMWSLSVCVIYYMSLSREVLLILIYTLWPAKPHLALLSGFGLRNWWGGGEDTESKMAAALHIPVSSFVLTLNI